MSFRAEAFFFEITSQFGENNGNLHRTPFSFFLRRYRPPKITFWHVPGCNDHYHRLQFVHANVICYIINF